MRFMSDKRGRCIRLERFQFQLFYLGLIHANHGQQIKDYLLQQLKLATTDVRAFNLLFPKKSSSVNQYCERLKYAKSLIY